LDGERNLKPKLSIKEVEQNCKDLANERKIIVTCGMPDKNIYSFKGNLEIDNHE
jgi:hypothetical protein